MTAADLTVSDHLAICNIAYEWADSYDYKDWDRLRKILAPAITLDFRTLGGPLHEGISPDEYVAILSSKQLLGNKRLQTQHLLGGGHWEILGEGSVTVKHQTRVAHQLYTDDALTTVKAKGHGYGDAQHWYRKIEGAWKLEKVESHLRWPEEELFATLKADDGETLFEN